MLEAKIDTIEDRFVKLQCDISENWNQVGHLEADQLRVTDLIKEIDIKIKDFENAITKSADRIKDLEISEKRQPQEEFKCNECSEVFQTKRILRNHITCKHSRPARPFV